jgi:hypothetical protein
MLNTSEYLGVLKRVSNQKNFKIQPVKKGARSFCKEKKASIQKF